MCEKGEKRLLGEPETRVRIFEAATELFSEEGFHNVSMRQIANVVGIQPSSIYNHFKSKDAILSEIFARYEATVQQYLPNADALVAMVGHLPPQEILFKTVMVYPEEDLPFMAKAMSIASMLSKVDERAERITYNLMTSAATVTYPVLNRMLELEVIEPLDVKHFTLLYTTFCYCAAIRYQENKRIETEDYLAGLQLLFQLVKEVDS